MCVYLVIYIHMFYIYLFTHTCVYTSFLLPFAAARVGRLSPYELAKSDFYPAPSCQRKINGHGKKAGKIWVVKVPRNEADSQ